MRKGQYQLCQARGRMIRVVAQPTGSFIVDKVSRARRCVGGLTEMVGADVSAVSGHLAGDAEQPEDALAG